jgi:hypothetical protein
MTATETYQYRAYKIVPMWQWSSWCAGVYATRPDVSLMTQSTLSTMASGKEEAVAEAKHCLTNEAKGSDVGPESQRPDSG